MLKSIQKKTPIWNVQIIKSIIQAPEYKSFMEKLAGQKSKANQAEKKEVVISKYF